MHAAWWVWQVLTPSTGLIEGEEGLAQSIQKLRLPLDP